MNVVTASPTSCNSQHQLFCKQVECQRQNLIAIESLLLPFLNFVTCHRKDWNKFTWFPF